MGPAIIVIVLLLVIPVGVMMTGAAMAALLGYFFKKDVDEQYDGSEFLQLS